MNMIQIEYFMMVAETGSFRQTAEKMYVSQPAVSKQISLLEKEWNIILFNRKYRSATLTKAGQIMYDYLSGSRQSFNECWRKARLADKQASSELRIGTMEHADIPGFTDVCARFHKKYPSVFLTVSSVPIYQLTLEQSDGPFDIVINHGLHFHNPEAIDSFPLFKGEFWLIFPKDHPLLNEKPFDILKIQEYPLFISASNDVSGPVAGSSAILSRYNVNSPDFVLLPNLESVLLSVKSGLGIAVLDSTVNLPEDGSIVPVSIDERLDYLMAWRKDNDNIAIDFFADMVKEAFAEKEP